MTVEVKPLEELIQELSPAFRSEVRNFVEFLLAKQTRPTHQRLRQDWAGTLRPYRKKFTSVELQHQALQ